MLWVICGIVNILGKTMFIQFLIEDKSTEILIHRIMPKIMTKYSLTSDVLQYTCKSFKGIGRLKTNGNIVERKSGQLLNDLPAYLQGFDKKLYQMPQSLIIVVLDNDKRDTRDFLAQLEKTAQSVKTPHVFCLAIKEMEAWLLGDPDAIIAAYPNAKLNLLNKYEQDAICDTWQLLAEIVYKGGLKALKKSESYSEIGKAKSEWAEHIGQYLCLDRNKSPSFQYFIHCISEFLSN